MKAIQTAALLGCILFAGCSDQPVGTFDQPNYLVHAGPSASMELLFLPSRARLGDGEAERLSRYLQGLSLGNSEDVLLSFMPSGVPSLDADRVAAATAAVRRSGVRARIHIVTSRELGRVDRRSNIVVVEPLSRGQLLVACPRTYADRQEQTYSATIPRLGCANAANLAHMAANPVDLVAPRPLGPADGDVSAAAVVRYRSGQVTEPPALATAR